MANPPPKNPPVWWTNAFFFMGIHIAALYSAIFVSPWKTTHTATLALIPACFQIAMLGITMGYHRLWTHRAFTARVPLRVALALMGTMGFQGSIKWWVVRHRLHHRYTDDPLHDPYAATRGLVYSHVGWIFTKPEYPRWGLVDKSDLERDAVVRFQHRYYVHLSVFLSFVAPALVASIWGDPVGGFVWGGLVSRLAIWHCTFFVNSLAHWQGSQQFTDEMTARGDWLLALLTSGEGNHNFHAFPCDYRNGPSETNWDPTRWMIWSLHKFTSLVPTVRRTSDVDVLKARLYMIRAEASSLKDKNPSAAHRLEEKASMLNQVLPIEESLDDKPAWTRKQLEAYTMKGKRRVMLIEGIVVDVTSFGNEHPGGAILLREHHVFDERKDPELRTLRDATQAFLGKFNNHTRAAHEKMRQLSVAKLKLSLEDVPELL